MKVPGDQAPFEKTAGSMWKVLKLVASIVALGTSVLAAVAATGVAGDGLAETFGGAGDEKGPDGAVTRKAS